VAVFASWENAISKKSSVDEVVSVTVCSTDSPSIAYASDILEISTTFKVTQSVNIPPPPHISSSWEIITLYKFSASSSFALVIDNTGELVPL